jgi:enoyl-CoA hydratase/carnithine racemase
VRKPSPQPPSIHDPNRKTPLSAVPHPDQPILLREDRDGVCTLTLNRPQQMNLLTGEMLSALQDAFDSIRNERQTRVIILAATGKGFCAGHDLKEIKALKELPKIEALFAQCSRMMQTIPLLPQPVIARVQGTAAAAGCQLVAQCDLAITVDTAKFVTSGVTWGFFCSTPGVAVGRNLQRKHALEMLLTGEPISAAQALEWGLVNKVVPAAELDAAVHKLASNLAAKPPATVAAGKRAFYQQMDLGLERAYALASGVIAASFAHEEGRAGMDAFIEKRPPPKH